MPALCHTLLRRQLPVLPVRGSEHGCRGCLCLLETGYLLFYHAEDLPKDGEGLRLSV
jgi:hypothetical protein